MSIRHRIEQGEGLSSIAETYGFAPETLWNHPENARLRRCRINGNILFPGDELFIPDKRTKYLTVTTGERHHFRKRGVPARLRVRVLIDGTPQASQPFRLDVDGSTLAGTTDVEGCLDVGVPPGARSGILYIGRDERKIRLRFSTLDPITELTGIQKRLRNLGFLAAPPSGRHDAATREALARFQLRAGLPTTGAVDEETQQLLEAIHDRRAPYPDGSSGAADSADDAGADAPGEPGARADSGSS